jgi:hypothetical protein
MDFNLRYDINEYYSNTILITMNKSEYVNYIIKEGKIIDEIPRHGEWDIIKINKQNNEMTIIDYEIENSGINDKKVVFEIIYRK